MGNQMQMIRVGEDPLEVGQTRKGYAGHLLSLHGLQACPGSAAKNSRTLYALEVLNVTVPNNCPKKFPALFQTANGR